MTYTEIILGDINQIIKEKKLNASVGMSGLAAFLVIDGKRIDFPTPKLAKIYLDNYTKHDNIDVDKLSGVSQKNDETPKKRRGRPKKADNDGRKSI